MTSDQVMNPKVSVVIPTYNRAAKVLKGIESVLTQTFSDLEVIVVDDGSADDTGNVIAKTFGDRIRYYYQANQGASCGSEQGNRAKRGASGSPFSTPTMNGNTTSWNGSSRPWSDLTHSAAGVTRTFDWSTTRKHAPSSNSRKRATGTRERWVSARRP